MRPFRFLAPIGDGLVDARTLVADARRAEDIGAKVGSERSEIVRRV